MKARMRITELVIMCILGIGSVFAGDLAINADSFELRFASDGKPASFKTAEGKELLDQLDPGAGFILKCKGEHPIHLQNMAIEGDKFIASAQFGTPEVIFSVKEGDGYIIFKIEKLKSVSKQYDLSLHFEMNTVGRVRAIGLDYMTDVSDSDNKIRVNWNHLSQRSSKNPLGGFAVFYGSSLDEEDESLLRLWGSGEMAHPKVESEWDYEVAKNWLAKWQQRFADQSRLWLDASSIDELYEGVKYAQMADIKEIFLFCNVWRGDPFWPVHKLNWEINKEIFPNGEKDVRKYSDFLRSKGISLKFHYVSGGLGQYDPEYIGSKPDRRLASWGKGRLAEEISADETTIRFVSEEGVELPFRMPSNHWKYLPSRSYALQSVFQYDIVCIGDELIKVKEFDDTEKGVWVLRGCQRGLYDTEAVEHYCDNEVVGIIDAYGVNFIPDNDSTLLTEIAENYASMLNRCGVSHSEFDGAEIHTYNGRMWGFDKFATIFYENIDHPMTANTSHAAAPPCFVEYFFNSSKKLLGRTGYHGYGAPVILHQPSRVASSLLDAHWALSLQAAQNFRRFNVSKPEPLFGISIDTFKGLGITEQILQTVKNWKDASRLMTEDQRQEMLKTLSYPQWSLNMADDMDPHPSSPILHTVRKTDEGFQIVPVKVLTREQGDVMWRKGQEHGPIAPKQFIKPGDELKLENIYNSQPVKFIIRVMNATDVDDEDNISLQPEVSQITDTRDTSFAVEGDGFLISAENARSEELWEESKLPTWNRRVDMSNHRGIGMHVTGDGSGSVLVFQIPGRDYVMPVNFKGKRYIEIPNGEAAWANGYWGWRMGTKRTNYSHVNRLKIGFGFLPPQTKTNVKVEKITALKETPTKLVNPVIRIDRGSLSIDGTIDSGEYVEYKGGDKVTVYDENWNKLKELNVKKKNYKMKKGWSKVSVTTSQKQMLPWLEVQFMTEGKSIKLKSK